MSSSASVPNQLGSNRSAAMAMHYQTMVFDLPSLSLSNKFDYQIGI
jgi:hypothetical protein